MLIESACIQFTSPNATLRVAFGLQSGLPGLLPGLEMDIEYIVCLDLDRNVVHKPGSGYSGPHR